MKTRVVKSMDCSILFLFVQSPFYFRSPCSPVGAGAAPVHRMMTRLAQRAQVLRRVVAALLYWANMMQFQSARDAAGATAPAERIQNPPAHPLVCGRAMLRTAPPAFRPLIVRHGASGVD